MRSFVPATNNSREAEELYEEIRDRVAASSGPVIERRIYRLKYQHNGVPETVVVGSDKHRFGPGPVVAIFQASDGQQYVCTQRTEADYRSAFSIKHFGRPHGVKARPIPSRITQVRTKPARLYAAND